MTARVGLAALGQLLQQWVGSQLGHAHSTGLGRWQQLAWSVHGRLSLFTRSKLAVTDPRTGMQRWLAETLVAGTAQLTRRPQRDHADHPALAPAA